MNSYIVNSNLIRNDYRIKVINLKFSSSIQQLEKFSVAKIFKTIKFGYKILASLLFFKPDLVYFTIMPTGFGFYRDACYVLLLKLFRAKILYHLHGKGIDRIVKQSSFKSKLYKYVFRRTHVICLSDKLSQDICRVYDSVPFIVPNGVKVQPQSKQVKISSYNQAPQILFVSNYIQNKGVLVLVEALQILKDRGYDFRAELVGAPSNVTIEMLNELLDRQALDQQVKIIGPLQGDEKFSKYKQADVFVFPTYNDSFPLVTLEAMQFSLPVVSTYEGSIPDIVVNNETGFLVETKNPVMLADKIAIILSDKALREKMGSRGYERFKNNFTLDHFERNIQSTFQAILERG